MVDFKKISQFAKHVANLSDNAHRSNSDLKLHQRAVGAAAGFLERETLGKLGSLGSVVSAQVRSGGNSPLSGAASGSSSGSGYTALKSDNVIAVMNSNAKQTIRSISLLTQAVTLQSSKINGGIVSLNNTMTEMRDSSQDSLLRLSEIRDILDKQSYGAGPKAEGNGGNATLNNQDANLNSGGGSGGGGLLSTIANVAEGAAGATVSSWLLSKGRAGVAALTESVLPFVVGYAAKLTPLIFAATALSGDTDKSTIDKFKNKGDIAKKMYGNDTIEAAREYAGWSKNTVPNYDASKDYNVNDETYISKYMTEQRRLRKGYSGSLGIRSLTADKSVYSLDGNKVTRKEMDPQTGVPNPEPINWMNQPATSEQKLINEAARLKKEALDTNKSQPYITPDYRNAGSDSATPGMSQGDYNTNYNRDRQGGSGPTSSDSATNSMSPGEYNKNFNRDRQGDGSPSSSTGVIGNYDKKTIDGTMEGKKGLAKHQQEAYNTLKSLGYDDVSAKAAIATLSGESLANPADVHKDPSRRNPYQKAHGIASWDDPRSADIKAKFGKMPNELDTITQIKAFDDELKTKFPKVYNVIKNPKSTGEEKVHALVYGFESPADKPGETNKRIGIMNRLKNLNMLPDPTLTEPAGTGLKAPAVITDPKISTGQELNRKSTETTFAGMGRNGGPVVNNITQNHKQSHSTGHREHTNPRKPLPAFDDMFLKMLANSPMTA